MNLVNQLGTRFPSFYALGGAVLSSVAALDMAQRAIRDLGKLDTADGPQNLSADLGGAIFYGLCATNIVPYTAVAGGVVFTLYSIAYKDAHDGYVTAKMWGNFLETVSNYTLKPFANHVILPIYNHVVAPLARMIGDLARGILSAIGSFLNQVLPEHPVWYGVAALVTAAAALVLFPLV